MIKSKFILFFFMISTMFLTTHCQSPPSTSQRSLRLNFLEGDIPSLMPSDLQRDIRGRTVGKLLYEGLMTKVAEGKLELAGAEKVEISPDGKEYLFTLRKHFWSDGSPVIASQYENAWKSFLEPGSDGGHLLYAIKNAQLAKEGKASLDSIGVQALDEKKLLITLEYPSPYFLETLSLPLFSPIKKGPEGIFYFNGPFTVKEWQKERLLHLEKNPHFWNAKNIHLNAIEIACVDDSATAFSMYNKGEIDWIGSPFCELKLEDKEHLEQTGALTRETTNRPLWVYFNSKKAPFTSRYIRRALSEAIDRELLVSHLLIGDQPLKTALPIRLTLCAPSLNCDLPQAKKHFEMGLQELNLTKEELPLFELNYVEIRRNLCLMLKEAWENAFGIKVVLRGMEYNVLRSDLARGNLSITICSESSLVPDPIELLERFESLTTNNFCHWLNTDFQNNVSLARQCADLQTRKAFLKNAEEILMEEMPFIPIANLNHAFSHSKNLKNILIDSSGYVDFRWAYWDLE